jgi:hypothetical protein
MVFDRFEINTEVKVLKALKRLLPEAKNTYSEDEILKANVIGIIEGNKKNIFNKMDNANIMMIIAKSQEAKISMIRFIDKDDDRKYEEPKLMYNNCHDGLEVKSDYNARFFANIIKLFECLDEKVRIRIKKDYPMTLENNHFRVILVPVIE